MVQSTKKKNPEKFWWGTEDNVWETPNDSVELFWRPTLAPTPQWPLLLGCSHQLTWLAMQSDLQSFCMRCHWSNFFMLFHYRCMKESILELPRLLLAGNSDVWPVELVESSSCLLPLTTFPLNPWLLSNKRKYIYSMRHFDKFYLFLHIILSKGKFPHAPVFFLEEAL